ncbi:hypothetical protein ElyMa_005921300 [Elysia marginata]|uniref:EGF-like domain-containing protein n=1 Tax=Elysia marginata TaxID=1093978 RepID=A0AAV4G7A4_9GAST|nr:hypothetical protein ElyMa_005921300 [Elysia marginata]
MESTEFQSNITVDPTLSPTKPLVTDQLGPTPGGTINCKVNIPCHFPVYTTGDATGTLPNVTEGPTSPDINVILNATVADNSTGLPGFTYLTPVTTISAVPGHKQLCVNIGKNLNVTDSACFHVIFTDNTTISTSPSSPKTTGIPGHTSSKTKFVFPTPPDGTVFPCSQTIRGCSFLVYPQPGNASGDCPEVSSTHQGVYVFKSSPGQCVNEVLILPQLAPQHICLQAGFGETRCFNISSVNTLGPALCQNVSCNSPHGACLADPSLGSTQCVCQDQFSLPSCLAADQDPKLLQPSVTNQIGPTPGATISCMVDIPCHFPVYTQGDLNGKLPHVTDGPRSPDINVTLDPTVAENFTALPGFTFLTPVTVSSAVPGQKQLCVNVGDQQAINDSACFHVNFFDNATATPTPNSQFANASGNNGSFLVPTPPDGSTLPCSNYDSGCHFLVYPSPDNTTGNCSEVSSLSKGVFVFPNSSDPGNRCVKEVLVLPHLAPLKICVQAGGGEIRCYKVPLIGVPGQTLCQNVPCNSPNGACLADPLQGTTQCVCEENFLLPTCLPIKEEPINVPTFGKRCECPTV